MHLCIKLHCVKRALPPNLLSISEERTKYFRKRSLHHQIHWFSFVFWQQISGHCGGGGGQENKSSVNIGMERIQSLKGRYIFKKTIIYYLWLLTMKRLKWKRIFWIFFFLSFYWLCGGAGFLDWSNLGWKLRKQPEPKRFAGVWRGLFLATLLFTLSVKNTSVGLKQRELVHRINTIPQYIIYFSPSPLPPAPPSSTTQ